MSKPATRLSSNLNPILKEVFAVLTKILGNVRFYFLCALLSEMRFDLELVSLEGIYYGTNTNIN